MKVSDNFSTCADENLRFANRLEDAVQSGQRESIESLRQRVRNTIIGRGFGTRRNDQPEQGGPSIRTNRGWIITEGSDGVTLSPHPDNRAQVASLEFDRDPARVSDPDTTMSFIGQDGQKVVIRAGDMNRRDKRYSGWFRQSVNRWLADGEPSDTVSNEIDELLQRIYTS